MSTPHFNLLSPAEAERLAVCAEEMGEAIQAIGKILRHGYESHHPDTGANNRHSLERELGDVTCAVRMLIDAGDVSNDNINVNAELKAERLQKWMHHADDDMADELNVCVGCGCDDLHACIEPETGNGCHWLRLDGEGSGVCSECSECINDWDKESRS